MAVFDHLVWRPLLAAVRLSVPMFSFGVIFFVDLGNRFYMDSGETEIIVE